MRSWLSRVSFGFACLLVACTEAFAQAPHKLLPVLTTQMPMPLSEKHGVPQSSVANDAGDVAWLGVRGTAVFLKKANAPVPVRAVQYGDDVPGMPGARVGTLFAPIIITANGRLAVRADIATTNRFTHAIFMFDGATLTTVVTGRDTAPNTGGAKFERTMTLVDMNDNGDILFGSTLLPPGSTASPIPTLFYKPFGGAVVRVAGPADASPGTGGTFTGAFGVALNNSSQILFNASITGGSGASGIFAWEGGVPRKIVATNDVNPLGGTFTDTFTSGQMRQNNSGLVAFVAGGSLWQNTSGGGNAVIAGIGAATPAPMNGTYASVSTLAALGQGGDVVFGANVTGGASTFGVFRFRSGTGTEVVSKVGDVAPSSGGKVFAFFLNFSVNAAGAISFQGGSVTAPIGIFQKPLGGALALVVLHDAATPLGGTLYLLGLATHTTSSGAVKVQASVLNAPEAYSAVFLWSATPVTVVSTADLLPAGAQTVIRPAFISAVGATIGVNVHKAGGRESVGLLNPSNQTLQIVATEGDVVPNTNGSRLQFQDPITVQVSTTNQLVVRVFLIGGGFLSPRNATLVGGDVPLTAITLDGQVDPGGRSLRDAQFASSSTRPIAINSSGNVAFTAIVNNGARGLFVANAFAAPTKVALVGDVVSTGQAITAINTVHGGLTESGRVIFTATTAAGQGLFSAFPGLTPIKLAQVGDAAPGGGTFSGFGTTPAPGTNFNGTIAFVATVSGGGTGGGIFMASDSQAPVAIVLNGQGTPGGGTYVINTVRADALINNSGDIAFLADITGGVGDSGLFIKRGPLAVELIAKQGQAAAGTAGAFETFTHSPNGLLNERFALSHDGFVAFFGTVGSVNGQIVGWWHADDLGFIQPILVTPSAIPEFDGGTSVSIPSMTDWMFDGRIPMLVPLAGGPHLGGFYLFTPLNSQPTGTGTDVLVSPEDPVTGWTVDVRFASVTVAGTTRVTRSASGPVLPRGWYRLMGVSSYYNITTTATVSGNITVCIPYVDQNVPNGAVIRLLHYENGVWVDITTVPADGFEICGVSTTLSPFVVAQALNVPTTNWIQNGGFDSGTNSWQTFDPSMVFAVNAGVFEYSRPGANAVVFQNTGQSVAAGDAVVATWQMGNSSPQRKRFSVLIWSVDFTDLFVCTFWLPPNTPLQNYAMRTHATIAWTAAQIHFYAASGTAGGGSYRLDNVVLGPGSDLTAKRTDCVDPFAPTSFTDEDGSSLISNGTFSGGNGAMTEGAHPNSPWVAFGSSAGNLTAQVTSGVAQFIRPGSFTQAGALVQATGIPVAAGQIVSATFQLGNSSGARKRITILMHDQFFVDLAACTFWLPAGQPLSQYSMRMFVSAQWSSAMISFYPATNDNQWFTLDNVTMHVTPRAPTFGSDCVEPGDISLIGGAPAPEGGLAETAAAIRPELMRDRFARVIQRLMSQVTHQQ